MTSMADWTANLVDDDDGLRAILREAKTVAVIGAKTGAHEPAFYVPAYLAARGYGIRPVNPTIAGQSLHAATVAGSVADLDGAADVVEIFRRPEYLPDHAREILALPWRPKTVWFQLGIRHDGAAEMLARAGIRVVQDRCMMPEHRRLVGG
jgi:predicted CoA-binding protein